MSMKPDYFIAHNGLPSILLNQTATRHMIRKVTATSRDNQQNNNMQVPVHHHHHLHRRNCISKSSKDLINTRLRDGDGGVSNKNSSVILSKDSTVTTQKCDNECNRNFQRWLTLLHIYKFFISFFSVHTRQL